MRLVIPIVSEMRVRRGATPHVWVRRRSVIVDWHWWGASSGRRLIVIGLIRVLATGRASCTQVLLRLRVVGRRHRW